jgi:hypothetical protein
MFIIIDEEKDFNKFKHPFVIKKKSTEKTRNRKTASQHKRPHLINLQSTGTSRHFTMWPIHTAQH